VKRVGRASSTRAFVRRRVRSPSSEWSLLRRTLPPPRDMAMTPFSRILGDLLPRMPGAYAAALVDVEGETVDYAGNVDPFDIKVAAAHWRIILEQIGALHLGRPMWFTVRGTKRSIELRALPDGYALVVLIAKRAGVAGATRALSACEHALAAEAGWPLRATAAWSAVTVDCDESGRPARIMYGGLSEPVEVIGAIRSGLGLGRRERGFRIRLASGPEITLVREPGGFWYAEERLGGD